MVSSTCGTRPVVGRISTRIWRMIENCLDSQAWDLHLLSSLKSNPISCPRRVTRLVLDPLFDLNVYDSNFKLPLDFIDAINYLLVDHHEYLDDLDQDHHDDHLIGNLDLYKGAYKVLQYDQLRRDLLEMELRTPRERSEYLCTSATTKAGSCVFKYWEELPTAYDVADAEGNCCCGVCGLRVGSVQPAYACHFCSLTLHKSCAEKFEFDECQHHETDFLSSLAFTVLRYARVISDLGEAETHACKSCNRGGMTYFPRCQSFLIGTHLKSGMLPTIINHDCHPLHFLSIRFHDNTISCKACGMSISDLSGNYVCHICNFSYHTGCVFMPGEVKDEHGGYEHIMKLMYTRDDATELEDDHWCNKCYKDMDPKAWFYSCQDCPYYVTHAHTDCARNKNIDEAFPSDISETNSR